MPRGSSLDKVVVFGVRESNLYRLKGKPMEISSRATKEKNKKVEQLKGSQPLGSSGKEKPSKSVQKNSWYKMTMLTSTRLPGARIEESLRRQVRASRLG
jgi:hypothetical protein